MKTMKIKIEINSCKIYEGKLKTQDTNTVRATGCIPRDSNVQLPHNQKRQMYMHKFSKFAQIGVAQRSSFGMSTIFSAKKKNSQKQVPMIIPQLEFKLKCVKCLHEQEIGS